MASKSHCKHGASWAGASRGVVDRGQRHEGQLRELQQYTSYLAGGRPLIR